MPENKLLENSQSSIQLGIEDYRLAKDNPMRNISAIRNIFAGLLLLYKYKLIKESPTDKPFYYITKLSNDIYKSDFGKKTPKQTIDVIGIKTVFRSLNINIDESLLNNVNEARNNLEHFYNSSNVDISSLVNKSFSLITAFYSEYIFPETRIDLKDFLGEENHKTLLENKEAYEKRKQDCIQSFNNLDFPSIELEDAFYENMSCPYCKSDLIKHDTGDYKNTVLKCCHCSHGNNLSIEGVLGLSQHPKDILIECSDCPECGAFTYILDNYCMECGDFIDPERDYDWEAYIEHLMSKND
ncbi:hypothetical protein [Haemophilus sp.]|uniref:hypothetical protein n=1 Tax=Haemophilus sp. TaxID=740 RepID=UPI003AEF8737